MMHFKSGLELTELQNMTVPEDDNISNDSNDFTEVENGQINRWVFFHEQFLSNERNVSKISFWFSVILLNYSLLKLCSIWRCNLNFICDICWASSATADEANRKVIYSSFQIFQLSLIKMYKYIGPQPALTFQKLCVYESDQLLEFHCVPYLNVYYSHLASHTC